MDEESTPVRLARIETKLDFLIDGGGDHESRIRGLEKWRYAIPPALFTSVAALLTTIR